MSRVVLAIALVNAVLFVLLVVELVGWVQWLPFRRAFSASPVLEQSSSPSNNVLHDVIGFFRNTMDQPFADLRSRGAEDMTLPKLFNGTPCVFLTSAASIRDVNGQLTERDSDLAFLQQHVAVAPGDVLVDIGANVGTYSVMLSKLYPQAQILSFEPMPTTFTYLQHNLYINNATNVKAYNFGIGVANRRRTMHYIAAYPGMSTAWRRDPKLMLPVTTSTITFESVLAAHHVNRIKLLKIDCESCEYEIMRTINTSRIDFICGEIHSGRGEECGFDFATIRSTDFLICTHNHRHHNLSVGSCLMDINKRCQYSYGNGGYQDYLRDGYYL